MAEQPCVGIEKGAQRHRLAVDSYIDTVRAVTFGNGRRRRGVREPNAA
ncbi:MULTISPECIES: hypothetical protein [Burkholderia]|nr:MULTISPECIES: hypothetical protein [Burkholderia]